MQIVSNVNNRNWNIINEKIFKYFKKRSDKKVIAKKL